MTGAYDEFISVTPMPRLITQCFLSPWRNRRPSHPVTAAVTAAMRVVGGIHYDTADSRPDAFAPSAAGLTDFDILVLFIAYNTNCGHAVGVNHPDFAARQADLSVVFFFGHQLGTAAGRADQLGAAAWLHLDGVYLGASGDIFERHAVASLNRGFFIDAKLTARSHAFKS